MARNVEISFLGLEEVNRILATLQANISSRAMMIDIGNYSMLKIKARTTEGKDVNGTPFKPYSPKYKLFREAEGHPTGKVNLFFTGSMLSSMDYDPDSSSVRIYFQNTTDERGGSNPQKAYFLNEEREFFALSENEVDGIIEIIESHYRRIIS